MAIEVKADGQDNSAERREAIYPVTVLQEFEQLGTKIQGIQDKGLDALKRDGLYERGMSETVVLEGGRQVVFNWLPSPKLYRPEMRLPSGSLIVSQEQSGDRKASEELFTFGRKVNDGQSGNRTIITSGVASLHILSPLDQSELQRIRQMLRQFDTAYALKTNTPECLK